MKKKAEPKLQNDRQAAKPMAAHNGYKVIIITTTLEPVSAAEPKS